MKNHQPDISSKITFESMMFHQKSPFGGIYVSVPWEGNSQVIFEYQNIGLIQPDSPGSR